MHAYPYLHAKAIHEGFKSEKVSQLIEDILYLRVSSLAESAFDYDAATKVNLKYAFKTETEGYLHEDWVEHQADVSFLTYLHIAHSNKLI